MGVAKDIHGEVFGRLTALYPKRTAQGLYGMPLSEYAEKHSINYQTAYSRFKRGALT